MKKVLSTILVAAMVLGLVGCGSSQKSEEASSNKKVELTFWAHQEESWNKSYEAIVKAFMEENPDIVVNTEYFPYDQFESKVQTSLTSKEGGADIYELWGGWGVDFASTGALAAIPDDMANKIIEDSYAPTTGSLLYDGKLYGIPLEYNIEMGGMLVNNTMLKEEGISVPTTWDELIAASQKATVKEGDFCTIKGFDFVNWDSVTYILLSMILGKGGQYLNEDGSVDFNIPEAISAFEELRSLVVDMSVTDLEGLTGGGDLEGYQQLFAGTTLFVPRGPWTIAEGTNTFELTYGGDFQYTALPWYGDVAFAAETGWAIAINGKSEEQDAAFKFLNYIYQDDVLLQHNINCSMIPPKKEIAHSQELLDAMPYVEPLVNILDKGQYIGYFNTDQFKTAINNAFVDYCQGVCGSAEEAMERITNEINESAN